MNPFDVPPSVSSAIPAGKFQVIFWINQLRTFPTLFLILLAAAGIILLLYGRSAFQVIVILHAIFLAGALGWQLGSTLGRPWLFALGFAVVFGILAWPLLKLAVAVLCGLAGVALATQLVLLFPRGPEFVPYAGAIGFILFAMVGWLLIPVAVVVFTALEGSAMVLLSLLVLAERLGMSFQKTAWLTFDRPGVLHAAILLLAVLGMLYQIGFGPKADGRAAPDQKQKSPDSPPRQK